MGKCLTEIDMKPTSGGEAAIDTARRGRFQCGSDTLLLASCKKSLANVKQTKPDV